MSVVPTGTAAGLPANAAGSFNYGGASVLGGGGTLTLPTVPTLPATSAAALGASSIGSITTTTVPVFGSSAVGGGSLVSSVPMPSTLGGGLLGGGGTAAPVTTTIVTLPPASGVLGATTLPALGASTGAAVTTPATPATTTTDPATTGQRLTTVAAGGSQADADLVEATLATLRRSASGAQIVDRLLAVGAKINVLSDAEMDARGFGEAHAVYDPSIDTMMLRRSDLANTQNIGFAAVALAHEGTHLLDDVGQVASSWVSAAAQRLAAVGGTGTAAGQELQKQINFELSIINEARAFTFAGQVARELNVQLPAVDPTAVAAAGTNSQTTYAEVWAALLGTTSYNPDRRSASVQYL